ncbi:tail fiber assembly protein [Rouxiella sp. T17]|uniref:tail fiber assembly protein n=1 Tax=Rouxiella sp. T17 TaxID=3085684 RepID=UPI002FCA7465
MFQMSDKAQTIRVYNLRADTLEFIGAGDAYIPPHTGLPAHCTEIEPPDAGEYTAVIFRNGKWVVAEDYRGVKLYSTESGQVVHVNTPGPLPENITISEPSSVWDRWDGEKWVFDEAAERDNLAAEAEKQRADEMRLIEREITLLLRAEKHGIASEEDLERLEELERLSVGLQKLL